VDAKVSQAWALSDQQRKQVCIEDLLLKTPPSQIFRDRDCYDTYAALHPQHVKFHKHLGQYRPEINTYPA